MVSKENTHQDWLFFSGNCKFEGWAISRRKGDVEKSIRTFCNRKLTSSKYTHPQYRNLTKGSVFITSLTWLKLQHFLFSLQLQQKERKATDVGTGRSVLFLFSCVSDATTFRNNGFGCAAISKVTVSYFACCGVDLCKSILLNKCNISCIR